MGRHVIFGGNQNSSSKIGGYTVIPVAEPLIGEEELRYVTDALNSGWISSQGKYIGEFEQGFATYCGMKFGVATSNGTTALHLALASLGIGPGHEVIVPTLTFVATANAVRYTGANPVFVDSNAEYWGMDPGAVEEAISPRTRAIIPVHLYGHPCDMDSINRIAKTYGLFVIEDAAEAHGARYKGRVAGSLSDIACFSFYGNKTITTGEGGMCLTNDASILETMRILRDHGMNIERKYWHGVIGFNYRMTNLQAAVGVAQVKKIDAILGKKRDIARLYHGELSELQGRCCLTLHPEMPWANCSFWLYSILVETPDQRERLIQRLKEVGVDTRPFFIPIHLMPPYKNTLASCKVAENLSLRGINLPSSFSLSHEDIRFICNEIRRFFVGV